MIKECKKDGCSNMFEGRHFALYCPEHFVGSNNTNPMLQSFNRIRQRAKAKSIDFDLTYDDVKAAFPEDMICPVLLIKMEFGDKSGRTSSPSIDRIDPSKGYVKGNIQVMCALANSMKQNATDEQLVQFAYWVMDNY